MEGENKGGGSHRSKGRFSAWHIMMERKVCKCIVLDKTQFETPRND